MNEDNNLVSANDLKDNIESLWNDKKYLNEVESDMNKLKNVRFKEGVINEEIISKAFKDVLGHLKWNSYDDFKESISKITKDGTFKRIERNGWVIDSFVNTTGFYIDKTTGNSYIKKKVILSNEFSSYLRKYCKEVLKDEVQFKYFIGGSNGNSRLNIDLLPEKCLKEYNQKYSNVNQKNIIMFRFRHKYPEIYVG